MTKTAAARRIPSMPVFFSVPYCPSLAFLSVKIKSPAFVYLHGIKNRSFIYLFLRTGFLFFSVQILTIFLRKRQLHRKFNHILRAPCLYRTAVQLHYLPGNGQAQPNTAGTPGTGLIDALQHPAGRTAQRYGQASPLVLVSPWFLKQVTALLPRTSAVMAISVSG